MLYREIIAVCSQIHTKHINTLCGQKLQLLYVKPGGTYSDHWALEGQLALYYSTEHILQLNQVFTGAGNWDFLGPYDLTSIEN